MRISAAGRYALRAMLDLAEYGQPGPVPRQALAERQGISGEYLAQLFRQLTHARLVHSTMGPGGGYQLARPPSDVPVGEILRAVEGPLTLAPCLQPALPADPAAAATAAATCPRQATACPRQATCAARRLWSQLNRVIEQYLDSVSLADLLDQASPGRAPCPDPLERLLAPLDQMTSDCPPCP